MRRITERWHHSIGLSWEEVGGVFLSKTMLEVGLSFILWSMVHGRLDQVLLLVWPYSTPMSGHLLLSIPLFKF